MHDMAPNDLMIVGGAALCSLLMVISKSRCTQISILWGLWKCIRNVSSDDTDDEEAPKTDADANADLNENQNP